LLNNYRKLSKKQQDAVDVILLGLVWFYNLRILYLIKNVEN
jgi:hypothetical protein